MQQDKDFIVRFAGEGGQGMVTAADSLAQSAAQVGYFIQTYSTFPSQIVGGPTWAQVRISSRPVLSSGDQLDALIAFNQEAYDTHAESVRDGGVIIYNSEEFELEDDGRSFGMRFDELGKSTGNPRAANMVVLGAIAHLTNWPQQYLNDFVVRRFTRGRPNDEQIIEANIQALALGREGAATTSFHLGELPPIEKPTWDQVLINGNQAIALGAMASGVDVFVGYPISPATTILIFMEQNLTGQDKFVYQASSEIESINAIAGAGFAGKKAMTSTAGPGLSLMSEGIGMAWMMEVPLVIADVQRGGPATGLPTKTEQSDFQIALHPAHGDAALPVIAPGTVEECFTAGAVALNWAERYQGPVILLSEHMLSERSQNILTPDVAGVVDERRQVYRGDNGYLRYESSTLSPMPIPGGPGSYVANASEHDPMGDTTHRPDRHVHMTERRFSKLALLNDGTYEEELSEESIVVMPWGGSKGPAREAYEELLVQGVKFGWYYTMYLHPLPDALLASLKQKDLVIVPELNYLGQFASYLRSLGVRAEALTQYDGLPFGVRDLMVRIPDLAASRKQGVARG